MIPDFHQQLADAAPLVYLVAAGYVLIGCFWLYIGWLPLRGMVGRLRREYPAYEDFVQAYLLGRGDFIRLQSAVTVPGIAVGVILRSFWGRAFRNLQEAEAEEIARSFRLTRLERAYSRFMLLHVWIVAAGLLFGFLLEVASWLVGALA